jgi:hypothetical protein
METMSVAKKETMHVAKTLTREDLWNDLRPIYIEKLTSKIPDIVDGVRGYTSFYDRFANSHAKSKDTLLDDWCEYVSEAWFVNHPDVDDVLLLLEPSKPGFPSQKEWIASRE